MNSLTILLFCGAIFATAFAKDALYKKIHEECQNDPDTHIDESAILRHGNDEKIFHARLGVHTLCMNVKLGIQKPNGDIDLEGLKKDVNRIVTECGVRAEGSTAEDAAIALDTCLLKYDIHGQHHN